MPFSRLLSAMRSWELENQYLPSAFVHNSQAPVGHYKEKCKKLFTRCEREALEGTHDDASHNYEEEGWEAEGIGRSVILLDKSRPNLKLNFQSPRPNDEVPFVVPFRGFPTKITVTSHRSLCLFVYLRKKNSAQWIHMLMWNSHRCSRP